MESEKIRDIRRELGMTQEELANALYVSRQTVLLWETDKRNIPEHLAQFLTQMIKKKKGHLIMFDLTDLEDGEEIDRVNKTLDVIPDEDLLLYVVSNWDKFKSMTLFKKLLETEIKVHELTNILDAKDVVKKS